MPLIKYTCTCAPPSISIPSLPLSLYPSLPPSLPPSLTPSLPHSLPPSLHPSLLPYTPPSLPPFLSLPIGCMSLSSQTPCHAERESLQTSVRLWRANCWTALEGGWEGGGGREKESRKLAVLHMLCVCVYKYNMYMCTCTCTCTCTRVCMPTHVISISVQQIESG